jgi:CRISPR-associated protein Cas4
MNPMPEGRGLCLASTATQKGDLSALASPTDTSGLHDNQPVHTQNVPSVQRSRMCAVLPWPREHFCSPHQEPDTAQAGNARAVSPCGLAPVRRQWLLTGRVDLAIATPSREAPGAEAIVVEYKLSEQKAGSHFMLQLAAYALLVEETWGLPVNRGFLYSIPLRKAEPVAITQNLRRKVIQTVTQIRQIVESEVMPSPPNSLRRCVTCEFRRFCNDVV